MDGAETFLGASEPTRTIGQLERTLTQRVHTLHRTLFNEPLREVICHCFGPNVSLVLFDSHLSVERNLLQWGCLESAQLMRRDINANMRELWRNLIAEVVEMPVLSLMLDTDADSGTTGIMAILEGAPKTRAPKRMRGKTQASSLNPREA